MCLKKFSSDQITLKYFKWTGNLNSLPLELWHACLLNKPFANTFLTHILNKIKHEVRKL